MPKLQQEGGAPTVSRRILVRLCIFAALALLTYAVVSRPPPAPEAPAAGPSYYSGPMLRKGGIWVTGDGTIVPPPVGWNPALAGNPDKQAAIRRTGGM
jgi:hypothetical protein